MRRIFISIIVLYAVAEPTRSSDLGKDGFNFYKDYLRARSDDFMEEGFEHGDRMVWFRCLWQEGNPSDITNPRNFVNDFYRTPLRLYPGLLPAFEQEYKKRNENMFKNHMMTKEPMYVEIPNKRTSKTALSFMMQHKLDPFYSDIEHYCLYGK